MITQYSRVQLTLSEKEKEYAWFSYAAKIIRAGCNDQQMSGYTVTGTGIDGQEIKAELTNEELFQLFSEITMKYGRNCDWICRYAGRAGFEGPSDTDTPWQ